MKTAREFVTWFFGDEKRLMDERAIEARDAEHIAESKAREEALRAEIAREFAERIAGMDEIDRLKGEPAAQQLHYDDQVAYSREQHERAQRLEGELAEARRFILRLAERNNCGELDCGDIDCDGCAARRFLLSAPSQAESTYVRHMYSVTCSCDKCGKETELRLAPRSEPPDDWREQFVADKAYLLGQIRSVERRLKALNEQATLRWGNWRAGNPATVTPPAAPQEQAGHAFVEAGWPEPLGMTCGVSGCGRNALDPIHTGAKP